MGGILLLLTWLCLPAVPAMAARVIGLRATGKATGTVSGMREVTNWTPRPMQRPVIHFTASGVKYTFTERLSAGDFEQGQHVEVRFVRRWPQATATILTPGDVMRMVRGIVLVWLLFASMLVGGVWMAVTGT
jgi:hypothetical protein